MTQMERVLTDRVAQVAADVDAKGRVSADLYEVRLKNKGVDVWCGVVCCDVTFRRRACVCCV